jgi:PD-(D/E)XK nuclease superfamily
MISASEISAFAYCPEQWRLEYGLGLEPENQAALDAGTRHHARKAVAEWIAGVAIAMGRILAVLGAVALLLLLWRWL